MLLPAIALAAAGAALQTTIFVDASAGSPGTGTSVAPFLTIQQAIDAASPTAGDTIVVAPGDYLEALVVPPKPLEIAGSDPGAPPVVMSPQQGAVTLAVTGAALSVRNIEFTAPHQTRVATLSGASVTFEDVRFFGEPCSGPFGCSGGPNGVLIDGASDVVMEDCVVEDFRPIGMFSAGTGVRVDAGQLSMRGCTVQRNGLVQPAGVGGGIGTSGSASLSLDQCLIRENNALIGGGVSSAGLGFHATDCAFEWNGSLDGTAEGGGVRGHGTLERCTLVHNTAEVGGGLSGTFLVIDSTLEANRGGFDGGYAPASLSPASAPTELIRTTIRDHLGFGIDENAAVVRAILRDCLVERNSSEAPYWARGGGVVECVCHDTTFRGNRIVGAGIDAAGAAAHDSTLFRCSFEGNTIDLPVASVGGAAFQCELEGCVLFGNRADDGMAAAECTLVGCVVTDHDTAPGRSALLDSSVDSAIVWANGPTPLTNTTASWSCLDIDPTQAVAIGPGNIVSDPMFWSVVGRDHRLRAGSPCIDAGDPVATDPDGTRRDMGAYPFDPEYDPAPFRYCASKLDVNGCVPLIEAATMPTMSGGPWHVRTVGTAGAQFGLYFISGWSAETPHLGGVLCVGGALQRSPILFGGGTFGQCDGRLDLTLTPSDLAALGFAAGDSIYLQAFYRAAPGPLPDGLGSSAGLHAIVRP